MDLHSFEFPRDLSLAASQQVKKNNGGIGPGRLFDSVIHVLSSLQRQRIPSSMALPRATTATQWSDISQLGSLDTRDSAPLPIFGQSR
jgi:hypothetical protein